MKRFKTRKPLAAFAITVLLFMGTTTVSAAVIDATRTEVFNAATHTGGSNLSQGSVDGETWTFAYQRANNFNIDGSTGFANMGASSQFGGTNNVFGDYHTGFGGGGFYYTDQTALATVFGTVLSAPTGGYEDVTISGNLTGGGTTTTLGSFINVSWKLVEYDNLSNTYTLLDNGLFQATSNGSVLNVSSGDASVSGMASLQTGDWVGLFVENSGYISGTYGGQHYNINDNGVSYSFEQADASVPNPAALSLFLAGLGLMGVRQLKRH